MRRDFYRRVLGALQEARIPFLIGGSYAMRAYAGIHRLTKDLDAFLHPRDVDRAMAIFARLGYAVEQPMPHWIAKVYQDEAYVDLIYGSMNGLCAVDDDWFRHSLRGHVLGLDVRLVPFEEMVWSKAFVMERDRFDGADIAHVLRTHQRRLDWERLLDRFGEEGPVLLSHLVLVTFIYPSERIVPEWVLERLVAQWDRIRRDRVPVCRGTLLAPFQYVDDVTKEGFVDARLRPRGTLGEEEVGQQNDIAAERRRNGK